MRKLKVDLALVSNSKMKKINSAFLGRNESTDVLAFSMDEKTPDGIYFSGEVIINLEQAKRQARKYGVSLKEELARLITHGALHLLGFEDKTRKGQEKMEKIQEEIVKENQVEQK